MKEITMFMLKDCPYCKKALKMMDELKEENPAYRELNIRYIDEGEQPELADQYDYWYVPTYYVGGEKLHEGAATAEKIRRVFGAALSDGET